MQHVSNKHKNHPDKLFGQCAHDDNTEPRKWIKVGMLLFIQRRLLSAPLLYVFQLKYC